MARRLSLMVLVVALTVGCKTNNQIRISKALGPSDPIVLAAPSADQQSSVEQVSFEDSSGSSFDGESNSPISVNPTIEELENLAIANNPAVAEAQARIEALHGKMIQVGLLPNPTFGLTGEDINDNGGAGRYGVFFGREIVRGNKLELSQATVSAEIDVAEQDLAIVQQRLLTDVRREFFNVLVTLERVERIQKLVTITKNAVEISRKLVDGEETPRTSLLQTQLEYENTNVLLKQAKNRLIGSRRRLAALLNVDTESIVSVSGDYRKLTQLDNFEDSYVQLLSSPELASLFADVEQRKRNLQRQVVEPIPNLTWQTTVQYDTVNDDVVTGIQIGMPLPRTNQNQGAIKQANHEIVAAERRAEKRTLDLRQRLATTYNDYLDAKIQVEAFEQQIIPKAKETLKLISQGYKEGEIPFLQWLTAQRTFSQTEISYLDQIQVLCQKYWQLRGSLLDGSLDRSN